jgi:hypothetical protein
LSPLPGLGPTETLLLPPLNRWVIVECPWRDKERGGFGWAVHLCKSPVFHTLESPPLYGASSLANKKSFAVAYFSDFDVPGTTRWHSCPTLSDFSLSFTP